MNAPATPSKLRFRAVLLAAVVLLPVGAAAARLTTYYLDADGDGHGNPGVSVRAASPPAGYVVKGDDCNDADPAINPDAADST